MGILGESGPEVELRKGLLLEEEEYDIDWEGECCTAPEARPELERGGKRGTEYGCCCCVFWGYACCWCWCCDDIGCLGDISGCWTYGFVDCACLNALAVNAAD